MLYHCCKQYTWERQLHLDYPAKPRTKEKKESQKYREREGGSEREIKRKGGVET